MNKCGEKNQTKDEYKSFDGLGIVRRMCYNLPIACCMV